MYDFFIILLSILVVHNLFLQHVINYYLAKKAQHEALNDFYRLMHSTNFDLHFEVKKKIEESDLKTKELFFEFRLYLYDKFNQNLETLRETDINEIKEKINELKEFYESERENQNL